MREKEETSGRSDARPFHIMCKPAGPDCNLRCRYCFYTEKEALFGRDGPHRMPDDVLEAYVRKYTRAQPGPEVNFAWQGGEPTLMGLDFFRRAVRLQKEHAHGRQITNSLQTNGILLDREWCEFLAREGFLVGLSIDGPAHIHDAHRIDRGGGPTFEKVRGAMERLQDAGVRYNTLTSVTARAAEHPLEIYEFLRDRGTRFMQFIPIVERAPDERSSRLGLQLAEPRPWERDEPADVMPWSVGPRQYGEFLSAIFDRWVEADVGSVFVQIFDVSLAAWMGQDPPLCNFARTCGNAMIIEHNGDLYSCDHFVYPDHRLGNILTDPVEQMVEHPAVRNLGSFKWDGLPEQCRDCDVLFICHGGCPKNRFAVTDDGEPGLNYLCEGYGAFFRHIDPQMKTMARLLRQGRAPAEIARADRPRGGVPRQAVPSGLPRVGRNDPCPCGSGRKYKRCCGRNA